MEITEQASLKFHGVDIANVQFDCQKYYDRKAEIKMNLNPRVMHQTESPNSFKIIMDLNLNCKDFFKIDVMAIGTFEIIGKEIDKSITKSFININAPAIMFPYLRSFIHTFSINIGNATGGGITIPTQFFKGEIEKFTQEQKEEE